MIENIVSEVIKEIERQIELKRIGKFSFTCADVDIAISQSNKLAILAEEFGEVSREVTELIIIDWKQPPFLSPVRNMIALTLREGCEKRLHILRKLRKELIEVAAVSVSWCQALDKQINEKEKDLNHYLKRDLDESV